MAGGGYCPGALLRVSEGSHEQEAGIPHPTGDEGFRWS